MDNGMLAPATNSIRNLTSAVPTVAVVLAIACFAAVGCGGGQRRQRCTGEGCNSGDAGDIDPINAAGGDAPPDAGGGDSTSQPPEEIVFDPGLVSGDLGAAAAGNAATPVTDAEAAMPGATSYDVVAGTVSPQVQSVDQHPGREATLILRWGYLPGMAVPATTSAWLDFSGSIAVSGDATIELVRALRWQGPSDPQTPRPMDFVAPQTDVHVLRFRSSIGSGSDALMVRIRRPALQPTVVAFKVAQDMRLYPLERFLSTMIQSGGWTVPAGNVMIDSALPDLSAACYEPIGTIGGTFSYATTAPRTALTGFSGTVTDEATGVPMLFEMLPDLHGPYGAFTGTLGTEGAVVSGYYGRHWQFSDYDNSGIITARISSATGAVLGYVAGHYDGARFSGNYAAFRPISCDAPGASNRNLFRY
jgi:hypothetical protein